MKKLFGVKVKVAYKAGFFKQEKELYLNTYEASEYKWAKNLSSETQL